MTKTDGMQSVAVPPRFSRINAEMMDPSRYTLLFESAGADTAEGNEDVSGSFVVPMQIL